MDKREIPSLIMEKDLPCLNYVKGLQGEFGVDLFLKNYVGTYAALGMDWKMIASRCAEKCNLLYAERHSPDKNVRLLNLDNLSKEEAHRARKFFTPGNPFFGSDLSNDLAVSWVRRTMEKKSPYDSCGSYYESFNPGRDCCQVCPLSCRYANRNVDVERALIRVCVNDAEVLQMAISSGISEDDFSSLYDLSVNDRSCAKPLLVSHAKMLWRILLAQEGRSLDPASLRNALEKEFLTEVLSTCGNSVNGLAGSVGVMLQEVLTASEPMESGPEVIDEFIRLRDAERDRTVSLPEDVRYAHFETKSKEKPVNGNGVWEVSSTSDLSAAAASVVTSLIPIDKSDDRDFDQPSFSPEAAFDPAEPNPSLAERSEADVAGISVAEGSKPIQTESIDNENAVNDVAADVSGDVLTQFAEIDDATVADRVTDEPVGVTALSFFPKIPSEIRPFKDSLLSVPCIPRAELCYFATCLDTADPDTLTSFVNSLTGSMRPCKSAVKADLNIEITSVGGDEYVYLMFVPNVGRYYYTSLRNGDVKQILSDAFRYSGLTKYCYVPYLLISSLRLHGMEVFKNVHSVYAESSILMPRHELTMEECLKTLGAVTWHGCAGVRSASFIIKYLHCLNRVYKNRLLKIRTMGLLRVLDEAEHYDEVLSYSFLHKTRDGVECLFRLNNSLERVFPTTTCADFSDKVAWCYYGDAKRPETATLFREMLFSIHDTRVIRKTGAVVLSMGTNYVTFLVDKKKEGLLRERILLALEDSASRNGYRYVDYKRIQILQGRPVVPAEK